MPAPTLPVSRLINVAVNLSPSAAGTQDLSTLLILGSSGVINPTERYRTYSTIEDVAADFGTTLPEYLAAVLWFEQLPQPSNLIIGRWVQSASQGSLIGAPLAISAQQMSLWNAINNGEFTYTKDGGSPTTTSPIDFTGAANLSAVAAAISGQTTGITFTWNSQFQRFEAVSATTGTTSAVSFLTTPGAGTDISAMLGMQSTQSGAYVAPGAATETAVQCVAFFDGNYGQTFYGVTIIGDADADTLAVAQFLEATDNKHIFFVTTNEGAVLNPALTSDIAYQLKSFGYKRTFVQYSSTNAYAVVSAAARLLTTDYGGNNTVITLMYKQEPGIQAEYINGSQASAVQGKNANVFAWYNNDTAILQTGTDSAGVFLDIIAGTDWLSLTIQAALYNLLYASSTKVPQTDAGTQLMVAAIEAVCSQAVINGLLAAGTWQTNGFGNLAQNDFMPKGFYVYAPLVSTQNQADRAARKAVPIQVAAKLAGAVHTIAMTINVNQ